MSDLNNPPNIPSIEKCIPPNTPSIEKYNPMIKVIKYISHTEQFGDEDPRSCKHDDVGHFVGWENYARNLSPFQVVCKKCGIVFLAELIDAEQCRNEKKTHGHVLMDKN